MSTTTEDTEQPKRKALEPQATRAEHERFELELRHAKVFAQSGMYPDATSDARALTKIMLGRELGLTSIQAMSGIRMVEGKPEVAAVTLAAFVRERPGIRYKVVELTNEACEIHYFGLGPDGEPGRVRHAEGCPKGEGCTCNPSKEHEGEEFLGSSRFTQEDAERAHLTGQTSSGRDRNHTTYPRNMKFARAMSNGVKWYVPEATGGIPVYHEGEIDRQQFVDGAPAGADVMTVELTADELAELIPPTLRDQFREVYAEAAEFRPGEMTPAAVQLNVTEQPPKIIAAYLHEQAQLNEHAREQRVQAPEEEPVADAEVVAEDHPAAAERRLEQELEQLAEDANDPTLTEDQRRQIDEEIRMLEQRLGR